MGGRLDFAPGPEGRWQRLHRNPAPGGGGCAGTGATQPPLAVPGPAAPRPLRLLVVDDAPVNRAVVRALLRPEGHVIDEAADGVAALAALQRGPLPDLVLMDVNMPGMDGFQATRGDPRAGRAGGPGAGDRADRRRHAGSGGGRACRRYGRPFRPSRLRRAVLLAEIERLVPGTAGRGH